MDIILALYLADVCQGLNTLCLCIGIALFVGDFFLIFGMFNSTDFDFYLEPNIKVEAKVPNCETREFKMW